MFSIPMLPQGGAEEVEIHIYRKDVYLTFCSWLFEISQVLNRSRKQSNSRCLRGMSISLVRLCRSKVHSSGIIHIGVGFCVARSDF